MTGGGGPWVGGLVAEDSVLADELEFQDDVDENLHDRVVKDTGERRDCNINQYRRI